MDPKSTRTLIIVGVVVALVITGVVVYNNTSNQSPEPHIEATYSRTHSEDEDSGKAYIANDTPSLVANDIASEVSPHDRRTENSVHYLQYSNHIVAIYPTSSGSKILLDDYQRGYQRHSTIITGWGWSSNPPTGFRGGGPGRGK